MLPVGDNTLKLMFEILILVNASIIKYRQN